MPSTARVGPRRTSTPTPRAHALCLCRVPVPRACAACLCRVPVLTPVHVLNPVLAHTHALPTPPPTPMPPPPPTPGARPCRAYP